MRFPSSYSHHLFALKIFFLFSVILFFTMPHPSLAAQKKTGDTPVIERAWQAIQSPFQGLKAAYNAKLRPWLSDTWAKIQVFVKTQIMGRDSDIKKEFQKEIKEMKDDLPKVGSKLINIINNLKNTGKSSTLQKTKK